jgi:hypothetical protein
MKLRLHLYRDTVWYLEYKESLFALREGVTISIILINGTDLSTVRYGTGRICYCAVHTETVKSVQVDITLSIVKENFCFKISHDVH